MTGGTAQKVYLAVVSRRPEPPSGSIALPLARDATDRRRVVVAAGGAACETRYEVLGGAAGGTVVRCELVTGRTHQIRVHLAASGWPILGDSVYGSPSDLIARQALHAWRVSFVHPVTREPGSVEAPIPSDMRALVQNLTL